MIAGNGGFGQHRGEWEDGGTTLGSPEWVNARWGDAGWRVARFSGQASAPASSSRGQSTRRKLHYRHALPRTRPAAPGNRRAAR